MQGQAVWLAEGSFIADVLRRQSEARIIFGAMREEWQLAINAREEINPAALPASGAALNS